MGRIRVQIRTKILRIRNTNCKINVAVARVSPEADSEGVFSTIDIRTYLQFYQHINSAIFSKGCLKINICENLKNYTTVATLP
jgi:hypothetical protein